VSKPIAEKAQRTMAPEPGCLPVGTRVLAFPGSRGGRAILTRTRSSVGFIAGTPCVWVEGYAGGIALTHIEVLPTDVSLPPATPCPGEPFCANPKCAPEEGR